MTKTGVDRFATAWLAELSQGRLVVQECCDCGEAQHPPGAICRNCKSSANLRWREAAGDGRIEAATLVHSTPFAERIADLPYFIARIRLSEGLTLIANLVQPECLAPATTGAAVTWTMERTSRHGGPAFLVNCDCGIRQGAEC